MRLFQFRDLTPIEAYVLALDYDCAAELFELHLQAHGGDPDTLLWRELSLGNLGDTEQSIVGEASALDRKGLVTSDAAGCWVFVTPLGDVTNAADLG